MAQAQRKVTQFLASRRSICCPRLRAQTSHALYNEIPSGAPVALTSMPVTLGIEWFQ